MKNPIQWNEWILISQFMDHGSTVTANVKCETLNDWNVQNSRLQLYFHSFTALCKTPKSKLQNESKCQILKWLKCTVCTLCTQHLSPDLVDSHSLMHSDTQWVSADCWVQIIGTKAQLQIHIPQSYIHNKLQNYSTFLQ